LDSQSLPRGYLTFVQGFEGVSDRFMEEGPFHLVQGAVEVSLEKDVAEAILG
jgi:hypothetical protein